MYLRQCFHLMSCAYDPPPASSPIHECLVTAFYSITVNTAGTIATTIYKLIYSFTPRRLPRRINIYIYMFML